MRLHAGLCMSEYPSCTVSVLCDVLEVQSRKRRCNPYPKWDLGLKAVRGNTAPAVSARCMHNEQISRLCRLLISCPRFLFFFVLIYRGQLPHHLCNNLYTLCVSYQFNPSSSPSSSPSSYFDHGPLVDLSCGFFHSRLKTFFFSKSFRP